MKLKLGCVDFVFPFSPAWFSFESCDTDGDHELLFDREESIVAIKKGEVVWFPRYYKVPFSTFLESVAQIKHAPLHHSSCWKETFKT